jgi:hypothetical protein
MQLFLVICLVGAAANTWSIVQTPGDGQHYPGLTWSLLLAVYFIGRLAHAPERTTTPLVLGSGLALEVLIVWQACRLHGTGCTTSRQRRSGFSCWLPFCLPSGSGGSADSWPEPGGHDAANSKVTPSVSVQGTHLVGSYDLAMAARVVAAISDGGFQDRVRSTGDGLVTWAADGT